MIFPCSVIIFILFYIIIFEKSIQICVYGNDIAIITLTKSTLKQIYGQMEIVPKIIERIVNEIKTNYTRMSNLEFRWVLWEFIIGEMRFEGVSWFRYMRAMIFNDNDISRGNKGRK